MIEIILVILLSKWIRENVIAYGATGRSTCVRGTVRLISDNFRIHCLVVAYLPCLRRKCPHSI